MYDIKCCDVIAVKREVAGKDSSEPGFSAERMSSYKTDDKSLYHYSLPQAETTCGLQETGAKVSSAQAGRKHTGKCTVTACRKIAG